MADPKNMGPPPAYTTGQYPPGAYGPPPPQGYAPPPQGYAPPPQAGYPPPHQQYGPPPMQMQQSSTNVVVVGHQAPPVQTVVVQRQGVNHVLHFIITLFFWPWIIVWIILCITDDS